MKYSYDDYVTAFSEGFKRVLIDPKYINKISHFVYELIAAKTQEEHHRMEWIQ